MSECRLAFMATIIVASAALLVYSPASAVGQVVFAPMGTPSSGESGASDLRIEGCMPTPDGIRVVGHVTAESALVTVQVTGGDPTSAGVRVGLAQAEQTQRPPGATVGDFEVVLPWADSSSEFVLVGPANVSPEFKIASCPHGP